MNVIGTLQKVLSKTLATVAENLGAHDAVAHEIPDTDPLLAEFIAYLRGALVVAERLADMRKSLAASKRYRLDGEIEKDDTPRITIARKAIAEYTQEVDHA